MPASVVVPLPSFTTLPMPLIVLPTTTASLRLKASVPWFVTLPAIEPVVPPAPTCNVPASIVVTPV